MQQWAMKNYEKAVWHSTKSSAKKRGLEFNIDVSDIIIPETCPLLNVPLTRLRGRGRVKYNASIDRIDSTKGYVKGNVQMISRLANQMKSDATPEELIIFARNILEKYS